jgi:polysaccharide deacetylase 2 family uncharacterized protein YibQ
MPLLIKSAVATSAHEGVGVEVIDRDPGLDDPVFEIEILHRAQPLRVEPAKRRGRIGVINVGHVAAQDALDLRLIAGVL